jgi:hypothetical protein
VRPRKDDKSASIDARKPRYRRAWARNKSG